MADRPHVVPVSTVRRLPSVATRWGSSRQETSLHRMAAEPKKCPLPPTPLTPRSCRITRPWHFWMGETAGNLSTAPRRRGAEFAWEGSKIRRGTEILGQNKESEARRLSERIWPQARRAREAALRSRPSTERNEASGQRRRSNRPLFYGVLYLGTFFSLNARRFFQEMPFTHLSKARTAGATPQLSAGAPCGR